MRVGVMVGKRPDGSLEYIGQPGDIGALVEIQKVETLKGNFAKTWIGDISANPLKAKKCVGEPDAPKKKAAKKD